jgi:hypothetical protein
MDRKGRANGVTPRSPDLTPLDFFLWGYVKDQGYSQRVNTLYELRGPITAAMANVTEDMLQRVWREVRCMQSYRWSSLWSVSHLTTFPLLCKTLFKLMNKMLQIITPISVFIPKLQVPEISALFLADHLPMRQSALQLRPLPKRVNIPCNSAKSWFTDVRIIGYNLQWWISEHRNK